MRYLRQYAEKPDAPLAPDWVFIVAPTPQTAALSGVTFKMIRGVDMVYAYIAPDTPDNRHKNGMPIFVHRFDLQITKNKGGKP